MEEHGNRFEELALTIIIKIGACLLALLLCAFPAFVLSLIFMDPRFLGIVSVGVQLVLPSLLLGLIIVKNRKRFMKYWAIAFVIFALITGANIAYISYDDSIKIDSTPSINIWDYLPFSENTGIVVLDHEASLQLTEDLPTLDGAAAVFPVYSAFVRAVYPNTTKIYDGTFEYNNTVSGYRRLAEKKTDIFFGAYPSEEQISYAEEHNTTFVYTPIGSDAFVFFVHKDNPVENLSSEQIKMIYSGEITNWKQVGGNNEEIIPYQRNEGSGSQSMFLRFMNGKVPMEPSTETYVGGMLDMIETVANYRNKAGSIGFSFRFYLEGIIKNPNIKMLSVDGIVPTVENIQNGTYPITTSLYAVTYDGNDNHNVSMLLEWILSQEGQEIIAKAGYVPVAN